MKKYQLGEFEEIVILTIGVLYKDAYGVSIRKEIESRLSRNVSMGALHTALVRLEDKGYIRTFDGEATEERMGRPKKYFQITALGRKAMEYTKETRDALWRDIPRVALNAMPKIAGSWKCIIGRPVFSCVSSVGSVIRDCLTTLKAIWSKTTMTGFCKRGNETQT